MRFVKQTGAVQTGYRGVASHRVDDADWEETETGKGLRVSSSALNEPPTCPYCEHKIWAMCRKGHVHCCPELHSATTLTCPWCNTVDSYSYKTFDVGRGLG
jgi:hypothetical protein